jgi:hypothetical protein
MVELNLGSSSYPRPNPPRLNSARSDRSTLHRLALIRDKVNSLASHLIEKPSLDRTEDLDIRIRTPPKKHDTPEHCRDEQFESTEDFLSHLGYGSLVPVFAEHQVSLADLATLSRQDLVEMQIPIGPRNRILKQIDLLQDYAFNREVSTEASSYLRPNSELSLSESESKAEPFEAVLERLERQQTVMMQAVEENRRTLQMLLESHY